MNKETIPLDKKIRSWLDYKEKMINVEDVREAVKELKEDLGNLWCYNKEWADVEDCFKKHFGKLVEEEIEK